MRIQKDSQDSRIQQIRMDSQHFENPASPSGFAKASPMRIHGFDLDSQDDGFAANPGSKNANLRIQIFF